MPTLAGGVEQDLGGLVLVDTLRHHDDALGPFDHRLADDGRESRRLGRPVAGGGRSEDAPGLTDG